MKKQKALEVLKPYVELSVAAETNEEKQLMEALQVAIDLLEQDLNFECDRWIMPCDKWCGDDGCKAKQVGDAL